MSPNPVGNSDYEELKIMTTIQLKVLHPSKGRFGALASKSRNG